MKMTMRRRLRAAGGTKVLAEQEGKQKNVDHADPNRRTEYAVK